ncbi:MAG: dihydrofolate reductase [Moraxella sp.]|nr:dihydrofolate reductase [Moraxella sp.]
MQLIHVVAMDNHRCIGKDNAMAWHIPEDFAHFRALTIDGVVIMGRKTFESIGRPLPKRTNIIISRNRDFVADGVSVVAGLTEALQLAKTLSNNNNKAFIIGGGEIYRQSLELADVLELTLVDTLIDGDTFYPAVSDDFVQTWQSDKKTDPVSGIGFRFVRYERDVSR